LLLRFFNHRTFINKVNQLVTSTLMTGSRNILHVSLYADRIWVPDPVEILAENIRVGAENRVRAPILCHESLIYDRALTLKASTLLSELEPLMRAGIICFHSG
jgi:hypothetical protein